MSVTTGRPNPSGAPIHLGEQRRIPAADYYRDKTLRTKHRLDMRRRLAVVAIEADLTLTGPLVHEAVVEFNTGHGVTRAPMDAPEVVAWMTQAPDRCVVLLSLSSAAQPLRVVGLDGDS